MGTKRKAEPSLPSDRPSFPNDSRTGAAQPNLFDTAQALSRSLRFPESELEAWYRKDRTSLAIAQGRISLLLVIGIFLLDCLANLCLHERTLYICYPIAVSLVLTAFSASFIPTVAAVSWRWEAILCLAAACIASLIVVLNAYSFRYDSITFVSELMPYALLYCYGLGALLRLRWQLVLGLSLSFLATICGTACWLLRQPESESAIRGEDAKQFIVLLFGAVIAIATAYWMEREERRVWMLSYRRYEDLRAAYPALLVEALYKSGEPLPARKFDHTVVLFADIAGSTEKVTAVGARKWFEFFNALVHDWDQDIIDSGAFRLKTNGDSVVAISGIPGTSASNGDALRLALRLKETIARHKLSGEALEIRIGVHAGPAIYGCVGVTTRAFDVLGEAVTKAARLQTAAAQGEILVSEAFTEDQHEFLFGDVRYYELKGLRAGMWACPLLGYSELS